MISLGKKISNSADFQRFEVLVGQSNGVSVS